MKNLRARVLQITSDVPWTAAEIADGTGSTHPRGKAVEPGAVERLSLQLIR